MLRMSRKKDMTTLTRHGVREKDPTKWKVLRVEGEDTDDPVVTFEAGSYTNRAGDVIPVIFHCAKSGIIYRTWEKEMERRKKMTKIDSGVQEIEEGKIIEMEPTVVSYRYEGKPLVEVFKTEPEPLEDKAGKMMELEDRKELAGLQWRLETLRHQLRDIGYCQHDRDICTGECQIREEIRELEKQCLRDP